MYMNFRYNNNSIRKTYKKPRKKPCIKYSSLKA